MPFELFSDVFTQVKTVRFEGSNDPKLYKIQGVEDRWFIEETFDESQLEKYTDELTQIEYEAFFFDAGPLPRIYQLEDQRYALVDREKNKHDAVSIEAKRAWQEIKKWLIEVCSSNKSEPEPKISHDDDLEMFMEDMFEEEQQHMPKNRHAVEMQYLYEPPAKEGETLDKNEYVKFLNRFLLTLIILPESISKLFWSKFDHEIILKSVAFNDHEQLKLHILSQPPLDVTQHFSKKLVKTQLLLESMPVNNFNSQIDSNFQSLSFANDLIEVFNYLLATRCVDYDTSVSQLLIQYWGYLLDLPMNGDKFKQLANKFMTFFIRLKPIERKVQRFLNSVPSKFLDDSYYPFLVKNLILEKDFLKVLFAEIFTEFDSCILGSQKNIDIFHEIAFLEKRLDELTCCLNYAYDRETIDDHIRQIREQLRRHAPNLIKHFCHVWLPKGLSSIADLNYKRSIKLYLSKYHQLIETALEEANDKLHHTNSLSQSFVFQAEQALLEIPGTYSKNKHFNIEVKQLLDVLYQEDNVAKAVDELRDAFAKNFFVFEIEDLKLKIQIGFEKLASLCAGTELTLGINQIQPFFSWILTQSNVPVSMLKETESFLRYYEPIRKEMNDLHVGDIQRLLFSLMQHLLRRFKAELLIAKNSTQESSAILLAIAENSQKLLRHEKLIQALNIFLDMYLNSDIQVQKSHVLVICDAFNLMFEPEFNESKEVMTIYRCKAIVTIETLVRLTCKFNFAENKFKIYINEYFKTLMSILSKKEDIELTEVAQNLKAIDCSITALSNLLILNTGMSLLSKSNIKDAITHIMKYEQLVLRFLDTSPFELDTMQTMIGEIMKQKSLYATLFDVLKAKDKLETFRLSRSDKFINHHMKVCHNLLEISLANLSNKVEQQKLNDCFMMFSMVNEVLGSRQYESLRQEIRALEQSCAQNKLLAEQLVLQVQKIPLLDRGTILYQKGQRNIPQTKPTTSYLRILLPMAKASSSPSSPLKQRYIRSCLSPIFSNSGGASTSNQIPEPSDETSVKLGTA